MLFLSFCKSLSPRIAPDSESWRNLALVSPLDCSLPYVHHTVVHRSNYQCVKSTYVFSATVHIPTRANARSDVPVSILEKPLQMVNRVSTLYQIINAITLHSGRSFIASHSHREACPWRLEMPFTALIPSCVANATTHPSDHNKVRTWVLRGSIIAWISVSDVFFYWSFPLY